MVVDFTDHLSSAIIEPIFPLYVINLGASKFELGQIMAIPSILSILLQIPLGRLADKIGKWIMLPVMIPLRILYYGLISIIPQPIWLYPAQVIQANASVGVVTTKHAIASDLASEVPSRRGEILGRHLTAVSLGMMAGPFLGSVLINHLSYRQMIMLTSIFPLCGLLIFLLFRSRHRQSSRHGIGKQLNTFSSFKRVIRNRNVLLLFFALLTFYIALGAYKAFFPIHAEVSLSLDPAIISILFAIQGLANSLIRVPAGRFSDLIGRKKLFSSSFFVVAFALFLLSEAHQLVFLAGGVALYGFGWGARATTFFASVSENISPEDSGMAMGIASMTMSAGSAIGSIYAGAISTVLSIPSILKISALLVVIGILPVLFFVKESVVTT
jgi:MFS family permease